MTAEETRLEIGRLLLENEIRYLAWQKEKAAAAQSAKSDAAAAPSQDAPAKRRGKKGV